MQLLAASFSGEPLHNTTQGLPQHSSACNLDAKFRVEYVLYFSSPAGLGKQVNQEFEGHARNAMLEVHSKTSLIELYKVSVNIWIILYFVKLFIVSRMSKVDNQNKV